jgi:hypothetical protein
MVALLEEAIQHQEAALRAQPDEPTYRQFLYNHHVNLASARLGMRDHASIPPATMAVRQRLPELFNEYQWASYIARCIPLAEKDLELSAEERQRLMEQYGNQALELLRAAQRKGAKELPRLARDAAFQPLRGREEFKKLLAPLAPPQP